MKFQLRIVLLIVLLVPLGGPTPSAVRKDGQLDGKKAGQSVVCENGSARDNCRGKIVPTCWNGELCHYGTAAEYRDFGKGPECHCYTSAQSKIFDMASEGVKHEGLPKRTYVLYRDKECNLNGYTEKGNCTCQTGYTGRDCSTMELIECDEESGCYQNAKCIRNSCVRMSIAEEKAVLLPKDGQDSEEIIVGEQDIDLEEKGWLFDFDIE